MEHRQAGSGAMGGRRFRSPLGRRDRQAVRQVRGVIWGVAPAPWSAPPTHAAEYEAVLDRTLVRLDDRLRVVASERAEAPRLHNLLLGRPPAQRRLLLQNLPLQHAFYLAARLIDHSTRDACQDSHRALEHAELATQVTARLCTEHYGASLVAEVSARAWASLGNACRLAGRLERAEVAFRQARKFLEEGSGEPLEEALVYEQEAALHATRERWGLTGDLLGAAAVRFHEVRDSHLRGRVQIKLGVLEVLLGRREPALEAFTEGLRTLEGDHEPYAAAVGQALQAVLYACEPTLPAQVQAREALRRTRYWIDHARAEPLRSLVRRVETLVLDGVPVTGPSIPLELACLVPRWPRRL